MQANVGNVDRALRAIVGLALLLLIVLLEGAARWWGLVGLVPLATALVGWCPVYRLFGMSTCAQQQATAGPQPK
jgi:hypothetical protein